MGDDATVESDVARWRAAVIAGMLTLVGACGQGEDALGEDGVVVTTSGSELGTILVDGEGMTLYLFDEDEEGVSSCDGSCAEVWPPLVGDATATAEADGALLGTTERDDGSVQVTYAGMPLYRYAPDAQPGDVTGQGVGEVWWVVAPDGERLTGAADAPATGGY